MFGVVGFSFYDLVGEGDVVFVYYDFVFFVVYVGYVIGLVDGYVVELFGYIVEGDFVV